MYDIDITSFLIGVCCAYSTVFLYTKAPLLLRRLTALAARRTAAFRREGGVNPREKSGGGNSGGFVARLEEIVAEEAPYLKPGLTLSELAAMTGTNRTYLSDYLCNVKATTFYDYINGLRINRKSIPLMGEHPEYTLEYIAAQSGFSHVSTFRRAFRKHTGKTPAEYRKGIIPAERPTAREHP